MSGAAFYWIGVVVVSTIVFALVIVALIFAYAWFIHRRFSAIFFRKGARRLSIASWYSSKLMSNEHYHGKRGVRTAVYAAWAVG